MPNAPAPVLAAPAPAEHPPLPGGGPPPPMPPPNAEIDFNFIEFSLFAEDGEDVELLQPCQDRSYRAKCGMFTVPCPRESEDTLEAREVAKKTKPADWKDRASALVQKFRESFPAAAGLNKVAIAFERHRWLDGNNFAWHCHMVFVASNNFAWGPIQKKMRTEHGVHGWFTFEVPP